jgi:DNA primase
MRDTDTGIAAQVERALLMLDGSRVHRGGRDIRFRCLVHDDHHPSADYDREKGVWTCRSCSACGGLTWGSHPLATLVGIDVGSPLSVDMAEWDRQQARLKAARIEAEARAKVALDTYWRERRLSAALTQHADVLERLAQEGIDQLAAKHFGFGVADYYGSPALAIPWMVQGELRALQYRLLGTPSHGGRYRWHEGSRTDTLYNADAVLEPQDDTILVVEGAKKCACLWSHGITSTCAVVNKSGWHAKFAPRFRRFARVVFVPDPDAWGEADAWARTVPGARVAHVPGKPDDFLVASGGDVDLLWSYIEDARQVVA